METHELIESFKIQHETCQNVLRALSEHFTPQKNAVMAQFKFFSHNQNGESFLNYYANLKKLVVECGFGEQEETILL